MKDESNYTKQNKENYHIEEEKNCIVSINVTDYNTENIQVYCFNGNSKIFVRFYEDEKINILDDNFKNVSEIFVKNKNNKIVEIKLDKNIIKRLNEIKKLSINLARDFKYIRVDWMILKNSTLEKIFFEELTFTPYAGYNKFTEKGNKYLGSLLKI